MRIYQTISARSAGKRAVSTARPKVLFIQPRLLFSGVMNSPNIGIAYIVAMLEQAGFPVFVIDLTSTKRSKRSIGRFLRDESIAMVCAGGQTAVTPQSLEYLALAKKVNPAVQTVVGGPHFSFTDVESLKDNECIDVVVRGEAEYTMLELCQAFGPDKDYEGITGITYRSKQGDIVRNSDRELVANIDSLPRPGWNHFPVNTYHRFGTPMLGIISSRGCVYQCKHCITWKTYDGRYRRRDPRLVVEEMAYVKKRYGVDTFFFHDDQSFAEPKEMASFLEALGECPERLHWCMPSQIATLTRYRHLWPEMKRLGLFEIDIGLEAAQESQVEYYNKDYFGRDAVLSFLEEFENKLDIMVSAYMVIGSPDETEESMRATVGFIGELAEQHLTRGMTAILTPFPGTDLYEELRKQNRILSRDWGKYDQRRLVMKTLVEPSRIRKYQMVGFMGVGSPPYVRRMWNNRRSENRFRRDAAKTLMPLAIFGLLTGNYRKLRSFRNSLVVRER